VVTLKIRNRIVDVRELFADDDNAYSVAANNLELLTQFIMGLIKQRDIQPVNVNHESSLAVFLVIKQTT